MSRVARKPDRQPIGGARAALSRGIVRLADPVLTAVMHHWLLILNGAVLLFVGGALLAPLLMASGASALADSLYQFYSSICHQWAHRSFFLLGPQLVISRAELQALGVDPLTFVGNASLGWKMAFCERDLAIFGGVLLFGLLYAARWRRRFLPPAGYLTFAVLIAPMAFDGVTQLFGFRESTWELRVSTGLLFGLASAWLMYPRFDWALRRGAVREDT